MSTNKISETVSCSDQTVIPGLQRILKYMFRLCEHFVLSSTNGSFMFYMRIYIKEDNIAMAKTCCHLGVTVMAERVKF